MKTYTLAALLVLTVPATHGQTPTPMTTPTQEATKTADKNPLLRIASNGVWWNTLPQETKSAFVDGYVAAMANVHTMLIDVLKQNASQTTPGASKPQLDAEMSAIIQLSVIADSYEYQEVGWIKLLAGMDQFYKEPLNKFIPIQFAFAWERDTLNGKVAPRDLQKQLDEWRAIVSK